MKSEITIIMTGATLLGCAGSYQSPESIESKMERFQSSSAQINKVPDMKVYESASYKRKTRGPASVRKKESSKIGHSNKKLYFLTLLEQYESISKYSYNLDAPEINICPSFHTILIDHKDKFETAGHTKNKKVTIPFKKIYTAKVYGDPTHQAYYPELMLPISKDELHPSVAEYISQNKNVDTDKIMGQAINIHLSKTHEELKELCDTGSSNNYYIYENLLTHIKTNGFTPNSKNMKTLLMTSIFTNRALIKSFEKSSKKIRSRGIASTSKSSEVYTEAMVDRLGVDWADTYFDDITSKR